MGPKAHAFIDWLADAGQSWWQLLPCHPTGAGDSPYQALSAFAGNPLFISLEKLAERGWLQSKDLQPPYLLPEDKVHYGHSFEMRFDKLRKAHAAFRKGATPQEREALSAFRDRERYWLEDWAAFAALKRACQGRHWTDWAPGLRDGQQPALEAALAPLGEELDFERFVQWVFETQWNELRAKAASRGIGLIGDLPIFVSHDSADVWSRRELFELDALGRPLKVAGVPPDYFSEEGQRWGNPLYRWDLHQATGFRWWVSRFHRSFRLFDAVRVDHFIGFQRFWEIPADSETARHGHYEPGPGGALFDALRDSLGLGGELPIIAEDLGVVTPEVTKLRQDYGLPGMRVLHFSFGPDEAHWPDTIASDCVAYTGTHDNDTTRGWLDELPPAEAGAAARASFYAERERALKWAEGREEGPVWGLIASALETRAGLAVIPLQDLLELGGEARMNTPGTTEGNWRWRARPGSLKPEIALRLRRLTQKHGRD